MIQKTLVLTLTEYDGNEMVGDPISAYAELHGRDRVFKWKNDKEFKKETLKDLCRMLVGLVLTYYS